MEPEKVTNVGDAEQWTDTDIDALIGIDADGNIAPWALREMLADATKYPLLHDLINAEDDA